MREPVLALPAILVRTLFACGFRSLWQEPAGPLPACRLGKNRAARLQPLVQGRVAHIAGGFKLSEGKMVGVQQAQRLCNAGRKIGFCVLEWKNPPYVNIMQVH